MGKVLSFILSCSEPRNLKNHIKKAHGEKNHICSECGEQFQTELKLETHIAKIHDRSKLAICHICQTGFTTRQNLAVHISWIHERIAGIVIKIVKFTKTIQKSDRLS